MSALAGGARPIAGPIAGPVDCIRPGAISYLHAVVAGVVRGAVRTDSAPRRAAITPFARSGPASLSPAGPTASQPVGRAVCV